MGGSSFNPFDPIGIFGDEPDQPDPYEVSRAQQGANRQAIEDSARINRTNLVTPFGNTLWYRPNDPAAPWTQQIELSPEQQSRLDQQNTLDGQLTGRAIDQLDYIPSGEFSLSGVPELPTDFSSQGQEIEQATYDRAQQLMAPTREEQSRRLETRLANQGIPIGSEAYANEMNRMQRQFGESDLAAALESVRAGRQEQSRLFGLNQSARQQGISDLMLERTQPMNELSALLQGRPALQTPQVPQTAQYQQSPVNISGLISDDYNRQEERRQAQKGGFTEIGSTVAAAKVSTACLPEGQLIDTPDGQKKVEDIKAGDLVIGFDGNPVKVLQHHAYVEDPEPKRFAKVTFVDGTEINLCDNHKIHHLPAKVIEVGDRLPTKEVDTVEWYNGVERSYDLLTQGSKGYRIGGVPVNSMIEEMMRMVAGV